MRKIRENLWKLYDKRNCSFQFLEIFETFILETLVCLMKLNLLFKIVPFRGDLTLNFNWKIKCSFPYFKAVCATMDRDRMRGLENFRKFAHNNNMFGYGKSSFLLFNVVWLVSKFRKWMSLFYFWSFIWISSGQEKEEPQLTIY